MWIALTWAAPWSIGQEVSREYQLKAVLLYNLTQFVEWPASAFPSPESPFIVCVVGPDPFGGALDEAVRAERSNNRPIVIRRINRIEEAADAQVVFFGLARRNEVAEALKRVRGRSLLTVSDFDGFLSSGGTVRMASTPDRKIKLRVNLDSAKASGLTMSAKLLRVCTIVQAGDE
ncbi:MAG: YfiR family protein [Verrucomicrobiales bacterium]|nr:YfiR family protein [Verrucomicrobiales bacterium]